MKRIVLGMMLVAWSTVAWGAADLSTPKAAARSLYEAISAGDRDGVRAAFYAGDAHQAALTSALADLIVAGKKLGDAAHEKFGKAGDPIGRGMLDPADVSKLDAASVTEKDDTATIIVQGQQRPMTFRKQNDQWRLVVTDFGGASPENIDRQVKLVTAMAEAMNASAKEVLADKYKTADAAMSGIEQRLHSVMLEFYQPATKPTTQATTESSTK